MEMCTLSYNRAFIPIAAINIVQVYTCWHYPGAGTVSFHPYQGLVMTCMSVTICHYVCGQEYGTLRDQMRMLDLRS